MKVRFSILVMLFAFFATSVVSAQTKTWKVGDIYDVNGKQGVVFEVWDGGRHGKIVSLDEADLLWSINERYIDVTFDESDGKANTDKVMACRDKDQYPAFRWCRAKGADWYLPAKDELWTIFANMWTINKTLNQYGQVLNKTTYWSSTGGIYDGLGSAWYVDMNGGYTSHIYNLSARYSVRAVSAF